MRKDGMGVPGQPKHQRGTENILYPPSPCSAEEIESKEVDWITVSKWGGKELQESDLPGVRKGSQFLAGPDLFASGESRK
jgi:hypothetical protein